MLDAKGALYDEARDIAVRLHRDPHPAEAVKVSRYVRDRATALLREQADEIERHKDEGAKVEWSRMADRDRARVRRLVQEIRAGVAWTDDHRAASRFQEVVTS